MRNRYAPTSILVFLLDVGCGIALILLACFLAGLLGWLIPVDYPHLYAVWFAIGLIPFAWFAHIRGAVTITRRELLHMLSPLIVLPFLPMNWVVMPIVFIVMFWLGGWVSALVFPENPEPDEDESAM